ncbi:hypothetical protein ABFX02_07G046350 [Erythranthe guttata]
MSRINIFLFVLGFVVIFVTTTFGYDTNSVNYESKIIVERPGKPPIAIPPRIIKSPPKRPPGGGRRPPSGRIYADPPGKKNLWLFPPPPVVSVMMVEMKATAAAAALLIELIVYRACLIDGFDE